jgi:hypothetical protein
MLSLIAVSICVIGVIVLLTGIFRDHGGITIGGFVLLFLGMCLGCGQEIYYNNLARKEAYNSCLADGRKQYECYLLIYADRD